MLNGDGSRINRAYTVTGRYSSRLSHQSFPFYWTEATGNKKTIRLLAVQSALSRQSMSSRSRRKNANWRRSEKRSASRCRTMKNRKQTSNIGNWRKLFLRRWLMNTFMKIPTSTALWKVYNKFFFVILCLFCFFLVISDKCLSVLLMNELLWKWYKY